MLLTTISPKKYQYILDNIDFFDFALTEQIRNEYNVGLDIVELLFFLTGENTIDDDFYHGVSHIRTDQDFIQDIEILKKNFVFTQIGPKDKMLHFFYHLMGAIDLKNETQRQRIPIIMEYIRYHKGLMEEEKIKQKQVNYGRHNK